MVTTVTIMAITMIIEREEINIARKASDRLLIYGRRKVGKTFLSRNYLDHDIYVFVKRGGGLLIEDGTRRNIDSYDQFKDMLELWIDSGKKIIVDEFQRLPDEFLDFLQVIGDKGKLILTGSSFHTIKRILAPKSPIMGFYSDLKLSLLHPGDIFRGLKEEMDPVQAYSLSPYLRDPWTLQFYRKDQTNITDIILLSRGVLVPLIGEVFLEEEKTLSRTYEGIIRSLSLGRWKLNSVAGLLSSRRIIEKNDPHIIRPYFNTMEQMDLVQKIPIYRKKEFMYQVRSPIMELGFMLDEKFNIFQQDIKRSIIEKEISRFTGELMAELLGGAYNYFYSREFDIDFIITRKNKTVAVGEVKWKGGIGSKDISLFKERVRHFKCRKFIFSKTHFEDDKIISVTPENILDLQDSS